MPNPLQMEDIHLQSNPLANEADGSDSEGEARAKLNDPAQKEKDLEKLYDSISAVQRVQTRMVGMMSMRSEQRMKQLENDLHAAKYNQQQGDLAISKLDPGLIAVMKSDAEDTSHLWERCVDKMREENNELKLKLTLATKVFIKPFPTSLLLTTCGFELIFCDICSTDWSAEHHASGHSQR